MISERLRDTYVMWSDPNSPYCDGTPHGAEVVLDAADVIDALVAALEACLEVIPSGTDMMGVTEAEYDAIRGQADAALSRARRK